MPRQVDVERRRAQACDAVADLAARDGFAAVTIRSVASALGASTSAVTHFFPSREELIRASVRRVMDDFASGLRDSTAGRDPLTAVRAFVRYAVHGAPARSRNVWRAMLHERRRDPVLADELDRFNRFWDEALSSLVADLEPDTGNRTRVVDALDVIISGLISMAYEDPSWLEDRSELVEQMVDLSLPNPSGQTAQSPAGPRKTKNRPRR